MALELKIGQKITVKRKSEDIEYASAIQNIQNDIVYINMPYHKSNSLVLMHNEPIIVKFLADDAAYVFESVFLGVHQESKNLRLYKISAPDLSAVKRVQQRRFARVPIMLDVGYKLPSEEEKRKGITVDLSAGGMKLAVKKPVPVDTVLELSFQIHVRGKTIDIKIKGQVVRCHASDEHDSVYHLGIKFLDLSRNKEDLICSFVFEKQTEQLRKL